MKTLDNDNKRLHDVNLGMMKLTIACSGENIDFDDVILNVDALIDLLIDMRAWVDEKRTEAGGKDDGKESKR